MRVFAAWLAFLTACSSAGPSSRAPHPEASSVVAPEQKPPVGSPRLVVQTAGASFLGYANTPPWEGIALSGDGALLAIYTDDLKIVSTSDGAVRAHFPHCAIKAAFSPDADGMVVLGCPEQPSPSAQDHDEVVKVYRWDLELDSVRQLGAGRFREVAFSPDASRVVAWGRNDVGVLRVSDGVLVRTMTMPLGTERIEAVSPEGDRARAGNLLLRADGSTTAITPSSRWKDSMSADLRLQATVAGSKVRVTSIDDGRLLRETDLPSVTRAIAFDDKGERLAADTSRDDAKGIQIIETDGKPGCVIGLSGAEPKALRWSSDGKRVSVKLERKLIESMAVYRADDCQAEYETPPADGSFGNYTQINGALMAATLVPDAELVMHVWLADPAKKSFRPLALSAVVELGESRTAGSLVVTAGRGRPRLYDPRSEKSQPFPEHTRVGPATLSVALQDGSIAPVSYGQIPAGAKGPLLLVDAAGKHTPLAKSEPYVAALAGRVAPARPFDAR